MDAKLQHMLNWDDLRVLAALLRHRTYKGAGAALDVAGSTIGRRLDALESALAVRLFDRTPEGVQPTAAAELLVPYLEQLEQSAASLVNAVEGLESKAEGLVRLTAPPGIVDAFVVPNLPRLLSRHPGLRLEIDSSASYADLSRREADLALRAMRPTAGDLVSVRVAVEPDVLLASRARAKQWGRLSSLAAIPFITYGPALSHIPTARWVATVIPEASLVLRTNSATAQLTAAQRGLGALLFPRAFAAVSGLVELELSRSLQAKLPPRPVQELHLVGHRALRSVPRVAAVWAFLVETFQVTSKVSGRRAERPA